MIGPNGSGKSNLIESLVFIFGRKASSMRLKQLSQLIHNSVQCKNIKNASVEVFFKEIIDKDDDQTHEEVPNSAFTVKRVVSKNNTTTYKINEEIKTQKEVIDLLKSKGIDLDNNRFMILQHEVEQISLMKPKTGNPEEPGLLEYLEDIIGCSKYVERIGELELDVAKLKDLEFEKSERLNLSELELRTLNEAKNYALKFVFKEKQVYQMKSVVVQLKRNKLSNKVIESTKMIQEKKELVKAEEKKRADKLNENKEIANEIKKTGKEREKNLKELQIYKKVAEALQEDDAQLQEDLRHLVAKEAKARAMLGSLKKEIEDMMRKKTNYERTIPIEKEALKHLEKKRDALQVEVDKANLQLRTESEDLRRKKAEITRNIFPLRARFNGVQSQHGALQSELAMMFQEREAQSAAIKDLEEKVKKKVAEKEPKQKMKDQVARAIANIEQHTNPMKEKLAGMYKQDSQLRHKINEVLSQLEEAKNATRDKVAGNRVVNEVIQASKRKKLNGVVGRLGSLGTIDEKFDVAVSTAGGNGLDIIVVNTFEQAQSVVNFCKMNNVGIVTCLALDKIHETIKEEATRPYDAPDASVRLYDMIKCKDDRYRVCFYQVLRDTLVCETIEEATGVAFRHGKRNRVVTLDGKLIEKAGVMSGGGRARKGGMSSKPASDYTEDDVDDLQSQLAECHTKLAAIQGDIAQTKSNLEEMTNDKGLLKADLEKKEMELSLEDSLIGNLRENIKKLKELATRRRGNDTAQNDLEATIDLMEREMNDLILEIEEEEKKIRDIDTGIMALGTEEQRKLREQLECAIRDYDGKDIELTRKQAKYDQADSNMEKVRRSCLAKEQEIQSICQSIETIQSVQMKELEKKFEETLEISRALQATKRDYDRKYEEALIKVKHLERILEQFNQKIRNYHAETDELHKSIRRLNEESFACTNELNTVRRDYKMMIETYDFIGEMDELGSLNMEGIGNPLEKYYYASRKPAEGRMAEEKDGSSEEESDDGSPEGRVALRAERKRFRFEMHMIVDIDINENIPKEKLAELERYEEQMTYKIAIFSESLDGMKPNLQSIQEFKVRFHEFKTKAQEFKNINEDFSKKKVELDKLKAKRHDEFLQGFSFITRKLKETYQVPPILSTSHSFVMMEIDDYLRGRR